ncbi:hypothetical protein Q8F57_027060 [Paraburkholderia terrae]|uniref:hypothetical protein n=1 Tax=Paraburkholderia terrae TaxID=311230 RepID=UPI00296B5879|nr:hypothetical protein [Paraburkholderia terrae]MDW3660278.1 hypothetical protein [Paraburkholderia terrae]
MTIPTKEAFADCVRLMTHSHCADFQADFDPSYFHSEINSNARDLIRFLFDQREIRYQAVFDHGVMKWLTSQNVYGLAERRVFAEVIRRTSKEKLSDGDLRSQHEALVMRRLSKAAADEEKPWRFRTVVRDVLEPHNGPMNWREGLLHSLDEYYHSDTATRMASSRKNIEALLKVAIVGIRAMKSIADDEIAMEVMRGMPEAHRPRFWSSEILNSQLKSLEMLSAVDATDIYPIARSDETMRERLFVYRMSRMNWRHFRSFRAEGIANLMLLEGFQSTLDTRTIEKMCKRFSESRRHLLGQIDSLTAGVSLRTDH